MTASSTPVCRLCSTVAYLICETRTMEQNAPTTTSTRFSSASNPPVSYPRGGTSGAAVAASPARMSSAANWSKLITGIMMIIITTMTDPMYPVISGVAVLADISFFVSMWCDANSASLSKTAGVTEPLRAACAISVMTQSASHEPVRTSCSALDISTPRSMRDLTFRRTSLNCSVYGAIPSADTNAAKKLGFERIFWLASRTNAGTDLSRFDMPARCLRDIQWFAMHHAASGIAAISHHDDDMPSRR